MSFQRRSKELLIHELADETLVYDLKSHRAHCLNKTAGRIWQLSDGQRSPGQIATLLRTEGLHGCDADVVLSAQNRLFRSKLMTNESKPEPARRKYLSRREMAVKLGAAALAPVVAGLLAPPASAQVSGASAGGSIFECNVLTAGSCCPSVGRICRQSGNSLNFQCNGPRC